MDLVALAAGDWPNLRVATRSMFGCLYFVLKTHFSFNLRNKEIWKLLKNGLKACFIFCLNLATLNSSRPAYHVTTLKLVDQLPQISSRQRSGRTRNYMAVVHQLSNPAVFGHQHCQVEKFWIKVWKSVKIHHS